MAGYEGPGKCAPSSVLIPHICQICIEDGECIAAESYCTVCNEFHCSACSNVHRRSRGTRQHQLLDRDDMSTRPIEHASEQVQENTSEFCEDHPNGLIKYFCPQHKTLHCGDCVVLKTHPCQLEVISTVAEGFVDSEAYRNIKSSINQFKEDVFKTKDDMVTLSSCVDNAEKEDIAKVIEFENQVTKSLQEHVKKLTSQIASTHQDLQFKLAALLERTSKAKMEATRLNDAIKHNENNTMLFISSYRSLMKVAGVEDRVKKIVEEQKKVPKYAFVQNNDTEAKLASPTWIGEYRKVQSDVIKDETNMKPGKIIIHCKQVLGMPCVLFCYKNVTYCLPLLITVLILILVCCKYFTITTIDDVK